MEELLHDALCNGTDVERADLLHDTLDLLRRDAVAAQTQTEEGVELFLKREVLEQGCAMYPRMMPAEPSSMI